MTHWQQGCVSKCKESCAAWPACEPAINQGALHCLPVPKSYLQRPQSVAVPACFILSGPDVSHAGGCHISRTPSGMHFEQLDKASAGHDGMS